MVLMLISLLFLLALFILVAVFFSPIMKKKHCPRCGTRLKSKGHYLFIEQVRPGKVGMRCPKCHCRCDFHGRELEDEEDELSFQKAYFRKALFRFIILSFILVGGAVIITLVTFQPYAYFSDPAICEESPTMVTMDECYYHMALKNDDVTLCYEISEASLSEFDRDACFRYFIRLYNDENLCNGLPQNQRDTCFYDIAVEKQQPRICYNIDGSNAFYRSACLDESS